MKKRCGAWWVWLLSAVVAGMGLAEGAGRLQLQSTSEAVLYFPDYVDGGGWAVQLVLSNIDPDEAASVEVEVFDQEGRSVSGFFDSEATLEIPPLGSRVMRSAGRGNIRRGWVQVLSQPASVRGLLTYRNTQTGIEVGVEPVPLSHSFALFVEETGEIGTGLAIFKPDAPSQIEFQIWDETGKNPVGRDLVWGDFKQRARTIPEWFEGIDQAFLQDFRGLLFLDAEDGSPFVPLGLRFGKMGNHSLSAVPVIEDQTEEPMETTLYFPDYVVGEGWAVQLVLSNVDPDEAASIVVDVYDQPGDSVSAFFDSETTLEIPPLGSRVMRSVGQGSIRRGWVQVQGQTASVRGLLTYRDTRTGIEVGVEPVPLSDSFALFVEETGEIGTGLAILKPDAPSKIELQIRDEAGTDPIGGGLARGDFTQRAQTIPEWFEGIDQTFLRDHRGLLLLRTEDGSSFAPLGLRFGKQGNLSLSAVPPIPIVDEDGIDEEPSRPPTVTMTVSSNSIDWGQSATLSWSSTDAVSATITPGVGAVPTSGSITVSPTSTTTYDITVLGAGGQMHTARASARVTVVISERAALVALNNATGGSDWRLSGNWLTDRPVRQWSGVEVDSRGRVIRLDLIDNGLTGKIPPELGSLTNLRSLNLAKNGLTGPIPEELGSLTRLNSLDLTVNFLTGPIPRRLGSLANLEHLHLYGNELTGQLPETLGSLANLKFLELSDNDLMGPIPEELGSLANLEVLYISGNHLTGPIPEILGSLPNLKSLSISHNGLKGSVPASFLDLELDQFWFGSNDDLCVPGTTDFVRWSKKISSFTRGAYCNDSDRAVLEVLHDTTGGSTWTDSTGWRGDGALGEWNGVNVDSLGRVTSLDLSDNGLEGRLPGNLALLSRMTRLRIDGNALSGRLPLSLSSLRLLRDFRYVDTNLCVPTGESFSTWLDTIPLHEGTDLECGPPSESDILMTLYDATYGQYWTHSENWLTDRPLGEWFGVEVDDQGRVIRLKLSHNGLTGPIPMELGSLTNLQELYLDGNDLTGPIPPELGLLTNLGVLWLHYNNLTGPIPKELGSLPDLQRLYLDGNDLTGPIPPELGLLTNLRVLRLQDNSLTGPIPKELGSLTNLIWLYLDGNDLTGPIPKELGSLTNLIWLYLDGNNLTGPIPEELGALANLGFLNLSYNNLTGPIPGELGALTKLEGLFLSDNDLAGPIPESLAGLENLKEMILSKNVRMAGALPARLTNLLRLENLLAGNTDLCAPTDAKVGDWLDGVWKHWVVPCSGGDPSPAYLTQAVQSQESSVPLVAGEDALVRVFVTAPGEIDDYLPPVRVRFYLNGTESYVANIPRNNAPIPSELKEGDLAISANAVIPGHVVQPGLEMVIEIDPEGTLGFNSRMAKRIPKRGRLEVDVRAIPVLNLTIVPFLWKPDPDSTVLELAAEMARNPGGHSLLRATNTLLPIHELSVKVHEPVLTNSNNSNDLISPTEAIRVMEGASGHYMGTMTGQVRGPGGLAYMYGWSFFARTDPGDRSERVIAHELGHNVGLQHPPGCNAENADFSYPHQLGTIGVWGYDFRGDGRLVPPIRHDLMSYCGDNSTWISDYHFANALRYRLRSAVTDRQSSLVAARSKTLMVWGGTDAGGVPFLESAFVVEAPAVLPRTAGEYELTGYTAAGEKLFYLSFDMQEVSDGDGEFSFVFALPIQPEWGDQLTSITLTGPGGAATLDEETDQPITMLRNPRTGQIRGILRGLSPGALFRDESLDALSSDPGLEILTSRGLPDPKDWTN